MRVSVTGFTPAHNEKGNRKGIIQIPLLLQKIIEDAGHEVGYNLPNADVHIIFLYVLNSLNSSFAVECLELMKNDNVIIALDDWHIKDMYYSYDKTVENKKFSKTHPSVSWEGVLANLDSLQKLSEGKFDVLVPAHKTGDHSLLGVRGDMTVYDPSIYVEKDVPQFEGSYDLFPVHASLANDWKYLNKRRYSWINVQNEKEEKVFELYTKHRIVMSPPYYHSGSGWWRNRYTLANKAKAVIIEDYDTVFGAPYEIERKEVTEASIEELFAAQDKIFHETIMSKEENIKAISDLLSKYEK